MPRAASGEPPRFADLGQFLGNRSLLVLLASGLALGMTQAAVLAYLALFAREWLGLTVVAAGGLLALVQAGGTASRLGWGIVSDRLFGGRRRPCVIINSLIGGATSLIFASAVPLPGPLLGVIAVIAGAGAFGWVGLYLALAAEVGGARYAGLLTGVAVACAWSGVLVGPPLFGLLLAGDGLVSATVAGPGPSRLRRRRCPRFHPAAGQARLIWAILASNRHPSTR